jgi:thioredoxin 1
MDFLNKMLLVLGIVVVCFMVTYAITTVEKSTPQQQSQNQSINVQWNTDLNTGLINAQKLNKLIFVDFYADWCGYCSELEEKTYPDANVQQVFAQKYVLVKINVDQNPDLASKYKVYGLPTLIILDANGNEIKRQEGYLTPSELLNMLK